jgi:hypothetical protein
MDGVSPGHLIRKVDEGLGRIISSSRAAELPWTSLLRVILTATMFTLPSTVFARDIYRL